MASPDSAWKCGGKLTSEPISSQKIKVTWDIFHDTRKYLKSESFSFPGATWNFFASFEKNTTACQFGINVQTQSSPDETFDCNCNIYFVYDRNPTENIKHIECKFVCQKAKSYWEVTDFLTSSELRKFLEGRREIDCLISVKNLKEAGSQTENTHSPENEVCQDFKKLLLSGEGSDVTLQVQDQEFKAHQLVITARSSVFASMFRHDMKEKATGVVNVQDCEPSCFPVLLEFLYCGSTEKLSVENMFSLYTSSDKYDIQGLKMKCLEFIKNNLSVETFCDTARLSLQHSEADLLKLTTDFFTRNLKKIIVTAKWLKFHTENPVESNEFLIKALVSDV